MTKWKYKILWSRFDDYVEEELNKLGKQGWEIVGWRYIEKDRNYSSYDEIVFVLKKKLVKLIKYTRNCLIPIYNQKKNFNRK